MSDDEIDKLLAQVVSAHTVILSRETFDALCAAAREANRLALFINDLSKKHADCTEGILFEQCDLDQAQALLSLGVFGVIEAEALALAIAAARLKDRLECKRLRARVEELEAALREVKAWCELNARMSSVIYYPVCKALERRVDGGKRADNVKDQMPPHMGGA